MADVQLKFLVCEVLTVGSTKTRVCSFAEEMIFQMEETSMAAASTRGVAAPGRPLSSGTLLTDEKTSGVSFLRLEFQQFM